MDYGKEKFGGPFTKEEVEDVKTVLRLLQINEKDFFGHMLKPQCRYFSHSP